jgi:exosortase
MSYLLQNGLGKLKSHFALVLSITFVLLTIVIVYGQDLLILTKEALQNDALTHIVLVPFLVCFLIYRKRTLVKASLAIGVLRDKKVTISLSELTGIALCIFSFLLYWYGSYTFYPLEYHIVSLVIFIIGMLRMLLDTGTFKAIVFPILLLIFLIPLPFNIIFAAGGTLGNLNTQASYELLRMTGVPVALSSEFGPPTIEVHNPPALPIQFGVDIPCSGIYSLIAFAMFATFIAYIAQGSIIKKIALFFTGFLMLQILNVLRITLTVLIAYKIGEEIAMTIFHTFSGWFLIFVGMLLLLITSEKLLHLRIFGITRDAAPCPKCDDESKETRSFCPRCGLYLEKRRARLPKRFWIKITALLLVSYLVMLSIQAPVFVFAQGLTISNSSSETGVDVFPQITNYRFTFLYRDQDFEKISHQDASLLYAYISPNISNPTVYVLVAVADSVTNLHSWETCLFTMQAAQGYSQLVVVNEQRDIQLMEEPPIIARYFVFQHPANYTQVTLYWYQQALFKTGLTLETKYVRINLITLTTNQTDWPILEQRLLDMGRTITAHWEPLKSRSIVSLGIPTMQALLVAILFLTIFTQAGQYAREWRRKTTNLKIFDKLASPEEKLLYKTINELRKKTRETTTRNIASAIKEATGKAIETSKLTHMLDHLEKNKIVNTDVANIEGQPRLVWKT